MPSSGTLLAHVPASKCCIQTWPYDLYPAGDLRWEHRLDRITACADKTFLKKAVASRATAGIVSVAQGWRIVNAGRQPVNRGALPVDSWRAKALFLRRHEMDRYLVQGDGEDES